jgi:hypothetical protein
MPWNNNIDLTDDSVTKNGIYLAQLQTLVQTFSSIESEIVREYVINLTMEILKISGDEKKVQGYIDDLFNKNHTE